ncbi:MAG: phosphoglucosamine mutase [Burkholderiaceae bacterium]|nr:phosphoglucosamine mutase [Burkholderiaceae bacterium]
MTRKYFGTDGVRGRVGEAPITPDFVMRLGYAAGRVLVADEPPDGQDHPTVLIGKDTRISGYMLEAALEAGFTAAGVNVLLTGPIPTPAIAYLTRALRLSAGVVLSASHNAYADNGIKFFSARGNKLDDKMELAIEAAIDEPMTCVEPRQLGRARRIDDAAGRYIEFCKSSFPAELDLRGLRIVIDCANGAAYHTTPLVLHELGAEIIPIGVSPNGFNINDGYGATAPQALQLAVAEHRADLGIAVDGDADRLLMIDSSGRSYNGDELLYVIVTDRMKRSTVAGAVGTQMTNFALELEFARLGVGFARAKVGDRYVLEMMQERGWLYGGEGSGHLLCLDCHSTGDGTISALQVLAAMRRSGKDLATLCAPLKLYPQELVNVVVSRGFDWLKHEGLARARSEVEAELAGKGRVLVRPSGTEPLLRLMVEAPSAELAKQCANRLADAVRGTA